MAFLIFSALCICIIAFVPTPEGPYEDKYYWPFYGVVAIAVIFSLASWVLEQARITSLVTLSQRSHLFYRCGNIFEID